MQILESEVYLFSIYLFNLNIMRFEKVEWDLHKWYDEFSNLKIQTRAYCIMPEVFLVFMPVCICGACVNIANNL
jgi:hypothetical protein